MASLNLDGDYGGFYWDISGLGNPFNTTYYKAAALASAYQGDGISSLTYVERRVANSSRTQYYTPSYWRTASPGTYTFYGYAQAANGKYYYCGADSVVVRREEVIPYYTVDTIGYYNFDVNWFDTSDYPYLRIYVRTTGGTTVYDQWKSTGGRDSYVTITGLSPGTTYVVNVAYNTTTSASGSTWIGSQEVTTETLPTYTYLYRARIFVDGVLYDYTNGTTPATTVSTGYNFSLQEVQNMVSIPSHTSFSYATNGNSYCSYSNGYFTLLSSAQSHRAYMDLYYTTDQYTLTASFYDSLSRNALSLAGAGSYPYGSEATLLATVRNTDTYVFEGWYDSNYNKITSSTSLNVVVTANKTYYARALEKNFTLSVYDYYAGSSHYRGQYSLASGYVFNPSVYSSPPSGYAYDHAECPLGTTVTSVTMSSNKSLYLFYTLIPPTTPTATISITERTSNSLSVSATITNILTYSDGWYLCISTDPTFSSYSSIQGSGSSVSHTFTGLSAHTTYYFKVANVYNEQRAWQSSYTTGTTRYASFVWDHNDNLDNRRPTANEWLRLVSFIEAVTGMTVSAAAKATIHVGGTLSHILFNELAQDVSLAQTVSKGTPIFKSVLNALRDKANTFR